MFQASYHMFHLFLQGGVEKQVSKPRSQELCSGLWSVTVEFSLQLILSLFDIKEAIVELNVTLPLFKQIMFL